MKPRFHHLLSLTVLFLLLYNQIMFYFQLKYDLSSQTELTLLFKVIILL